MLSYEEVARELSRELREWRESSPEASDYTGEFYEKVLRYLDVIRQGRTIDMVDWQYNALMRHIMANGPMSGDFLPSLSKLSATIAQDRKSGVSRGAPVEPCPVRPQGCQ